MGEAVVAGHCEREDWVVGDPAGEAECPGGEVGQDDEVGLQPLRRVDRAEGEVQVRVAPAAEEVAFEAVATEHVDAAARRGLGEAAEMRGDRGRDRLPAGQAHHGHRRAAGPAGGADGLAKLARVSRDEAAGHIGDRLGAAERRLQSSRQRGTEVRVEVCHHCEIGPGEAVDGLPVVADSEEMLFGADDEGLRQAGPRPAGVLELVDHDEIPALKVRVLFDEFRGP